MGTERQEGWVLNGPKSTLTTFDRGQIEQVRTLIMTLDDCDKEDVTATKAYIDIKIHPDAVVTGPASTVGSKMLTTPVNGVNSDIYVKLDVSPWLTIPMFFQFTPERKTVNHHVAMMYIRQSKRPFKSAVEFYQFLLDNPDKHGFDKEQMDFYKDIVLAWDYNEPRKGAPNA